MLQMTQLIKMIQMILIHSNYFEIEFIWQH